MTLTGPALLRSGRDFTDLKGVADTFARFNRLLQVLDTTGGQRPGSPTAFNAAMRDLQQGGLVGEAAAALSPQKALSFVSDTYQRFRLGRGVDDLARSSAQPAGASKPDKFEYFSPIPRAGD